MFHKNDMPTYGAPLDPRDASTLGTEGAADVMRVLALRENNAATPMHALPGLARELGLGSLHVKDEGYRLGLGSFKALGGAYALLRLVQEQASQHWGREVPLRELMSPDVRSIAAGMTFACATDGNHGRSVAQGAQLIGANAVIFVHAGVSDARVDAIAGFGARIIRVDGNYDDSVAEASRVSEREGWTVLSDTSWPGYERIPALVMQGYTAILQEALSQLDEPPTHVFLQAGVGGFAAAIAGHLAVVLGERRPHVTVVDPARAACLFQSAKAGHIVKVEEEEATVMAMLECYEPSLVAFRVLERVADGFMTVDEDDAIEVMTRMAHPVAGDPAVVCGESGGAGLAGLFVAARQADIREVVGLGSGARVLCINTEGATDPALYERLTGRRPQDVPGAEA
ncbi:diaminopropionate ammonia-lyase [Sedimentitalea sp. XS_ASV28]|uniref:diaminopropionate ammonia-lyase n=1 Tax=Sedimentitalea sp. XS_ASV28 TaxID=3241296 RepID=UPI003519729C